MDTGKKSTSKFCALRKKGKLFSCVCSSSQTPRNFFAQRPVLSTVCPVKQIKKTSRKKTMEKLNVDVKFVYAEPAAHFTDETGRCGASLISSRRVSVKINSSAITFGFHT